MGWSEKKFVCTDTFTDPEQTLFGHESRMYLLCKPSYGQFSVKISKFSLPWQDGSSDQSLTNTTKLADLENPQRASIRDVCPVKAKL